jgi:Ca2+-binding RTX toxin-like protein
MGAMVLERDGGAAVDAGDGVTLSAETKPDWLSFDASTGVLSGTPTNDDVGEYSVVLRATDASGAFEEQRFTLTVSNVNDAMPEIIGSNKRDILIGSRDAEKFYGEAGGDTILGRGGNDEIYGGSGRDTLRGGSGDDVLDGGDGHDTLQGGAGSDFLFGGAGRDELKGNAGADTLEGGLGRDFLYAGVDNDVDTFVFRHLEDSGRGRNSDQIFQFDSGEDKIDLQFIDANTLLVGDQSFEFSEGRAAHSIWVTDSKRDLLVRGDVDGDARHDFEIVLNNLSDISEYDFIL